MAPKKAESKSTTTRLSKSDVLARNRRISQLLGVLGLVTLIGMYYGWELVVVPRLRLERVHVHTMQDRLVLALRNQVPSLVTLAVSWLHVALTRALTAAVNPLGGHEDLVELPNRILTNTLEQLILSSLNQLIMATYLPEEKLRLLPLVTATFVLGRLTFALGYLKSPWWRSFGLVITTVPTLGMVGYNTWWLATQGLTARLGTSSSRS